MSYYDFNNHFWSHKEVGGGQVLRQKSQGVLRTGGLTTTLTGWLLNRRDRTSSQSKSVLHANVLHPMAEGEIRTPQ